MDQNPKHRREPPVSYRPPAGLRDEFHTRVRNSGLPVNAFLTAAVFGQIAPKARRTVLFDQYAASTLLSKAARINDQLRAMSNTADDPYHSSLIEECRDELIEIRNCLLVVLGRQP